MGALVPGALWSPMLCAVLALIVQVPLTGCAQASLGRDGPGDATATGFSPDAGDQATQPGSPLPEGSDGGGIVDGGDDCAVVPGADRPDAGTDDEGGGCDADRDGIGDAADNCPVVPNPDQGDADADGLGDLCDEDWDGDGIHNTRDNCLFVPNADLCDGDGDGQGDACDDDSDDDTVGNAADNCPSVPNLDQADADGDGRGDACDDDWDQDGVPNDSDDCPTTPNVDQSDLDADGRGDSCDNCQAVANADQADLDSDGSGNACDDDRDGDGVADASDVCVNIPDPDQSDRNGDGIGDACAECAVRLFAATAPVRGDTLEDATDGDDLCASELGEGWAWLEFHENGGWSASGEWITEIPAQRAWVWIDDQSANCFDNDHGMTWVGRPGEEDRCPSALCGSAEGFQDGDRPRDQNGNCDPYDGDTPCSAERPLLCVQAGEGNGGGGDDGGDVDR